MNRELVKIYVNRIKKYVCIILIVVFVSGVSFGTFKIYTEARTAFKEAKNIKLAFSMLAVEYYGKGKEIYNSTNKNGLSDGVEERLLEVIENEGEITIIRYNANDHEVKAFSYESGIYKVLFDENNSASEWKVYISFPIMHYKD